jgi:hypothetical protein
MKSVTNSNNTPNSYYYIESNRREKTRYNYAENISCPCTQFISTYDIPLWHMNNDKEVKTVNDNYV